MNKAEERAFERCPKSENMREEMRNEIRRAQFVEGYRQAAKDLALTWKDVRLLCDKFMDVGLKSNYPARSKEFYEEVLKRFLEMKTN